MKLKEKSQGRVAWGKTIAKSKWGDRFRGAITEKDGIHKVVLALKVFEWGEYKEYIFAGKDRMATLRKAFKEMEKYLK